MKITNISLQVKNPDRVNVSVDGVYRFSLDIAQVSELGVKVGKEYDETELTEIEHESQFGKLYARALEYTLLRPHSSREIRDYLYKKTRTTMYRARDGQVKEREGVSETITNRVFDRLVSRGYVDDERFARFWIENRHLTKGASRRKLTAELRQKGIASSIIEEVMAESERSDIDELQKMILKKRPRYPEEQKLIAYLARQGFSYDDIVTALRGLSDID